MKRLSVAAFVMMIAVFSAYPFSWPVDDPSITHSFGGDLWGGFLPGLFVTGDSDSVSPAEPGEVIFRQDSDAPINSIPSGMGSFVVVEHQRKLRSLYGFLDEGSTPHASEAVGPGDVIGKLNGSGERKGPLYFSVIDSEFSQFVNPLLLLDTVKDISSPRISEFGFLKDGKYYRINGKTVLPAGPGEIVADIYDPAGSGGLSGRMAPHRIHLFLNGEEIFFLNFESVRARDGMYMLKSRTEVLYDDYYRGGGRVSLGRINLVPGDANFEVLVSDYSGNETSGIFRATVTE